jgi:hypothetical protein
MSELVKFSGTSRNLMNVEELMELCVRDLPKAMRRRSK